MIWPSGTIAILSRQSRSLVVSLPFSSATSLVLLKLLIRGNQFVYRWMDDVDREKELNTEDEKSEARVGRVEGREDEEEELRRNSKWPNAGQAGHILRTWCEGGKEEEKKGKEECEDENWRKRTTPL
ncbi:hypothetical protein BLNAU_11198 [Blattamonas nauphoetae]|uniref:Uncharacterized protein n=1 Tax=Blattamonas nauphoetae TaxID=2049346 RepID=A0ABQ9XQL7_9EUKA|nr:hypothetical protein BLNAU_11198 [Blattamonas nauphoetae]